MCDREEFYKHVKDIKNCSGPRSPRKIIRLSWGLPRSWQGWLVFGAYFISIGTGLYIFQPLDKHIFEYNIYVGAVTVVLLSICWLKGEKSSR